MNAPAAFLTIRWLVWDTFRQSMASRLFWLMLTVSGVCIAVCLTMGFTDLPRKPVDVPAERLPASEAARHTPLDVKTAGVDVIEGEVTFLFGAIRVPWNSYRDDAVRYVLLLLAGGVADAAGLLLALIWTAAFLPTFLDPANATVLLAKPVPRWSLLAGKYVGVLMFVLFQAVVFIGGTWIAVGVRTGVWDNRYLLAVPILLCHFAIFFSFSAFLAVWTRSTIACVVGSLAFWMLCWGMNYARHAALALGPEAGGLFASTSWLLEVGYWVLPKPADFNVLLLDTFQSDSFKLFEFRKVQEIGALHIELSILASLLFAVVKLGLTAYEFVRAEY